MKRRTKDEIHRARIIAATVDPWADDPVVPVVEHAPQPRIGRCGKFCYASERSATNKARGVQRVRDGRLRVYYCRRCGAYHLTSEPKDSK